MFKQKTAYEMRISDWSSDVCSSDLHSGPGRDPLRRLRQLVVDVVVGVVDEARRGPVALRPGQTRTCAQVERVVDGVADVDGGLGGNFPDFVGPQLAEVEAGGELAEARAEILVDVEIAAAHPGAGLVARASIEGGLPCVEARSAERRLGKDG